MKLIAEEGKMTFLTNTRKNTMTKTSKKQGVYNINILKFDGIMEAYATRRTGEDRNEAECRASADPRHQPSNAPIYQRLRTGADFHIEKPAYLQGISEASSKLIKKEVIKQLRAQGYKILNILDNR